MLLIIILLLKQKQNRWNIRDDNRKTNVLKSCSSKWRAFKKRLKKIILANKRDPLQMYSFLEKSTLEKFKERILSKEFQVCWTLMYLNSINYYVVFFIIVFVTSIGR